MTSDDERDKSTGQPAGTIEPLDERTFHDKGTLAVELAKKLDAVIEAVNSHEQRITAVRDSNVEAHRSAYKWLTETCTRLTAVEQRLDRLESDGKTPCAKNDCRGIMSSRHLPSCPMSFGREAAPEKPGDAPAALTNRDDWAMYYGGKGGIELEAWTRGRQDGYAGYERWRARATAAEAQAKHLSAVLSRCEESKNLWESAAREVDGQKAAAERDRDGYKNGLLSAQAEVERLTAREAELKAIINSMSERGEETGFDLSVHCMVCGKRHDLPGCELPGTAPQWAVETARAVFKWFDEVDNLTDEAHIAGIAAIIAKGAASRPDMKTLGECTDAAFRRGVESAAETNAAAVTAAYERGRASRASLRKEDQQWWYEHGYKDGQRDIDSREYERGDADGYKRGVRDGFTNAQKQVTPEQLDALGLTHGYCCDCWCPCTARMGRGPQICEDCAEGNCFRDGSGRRSLAPPAPTSSNPTVKPADLAHDWDGIFCRNCGAARACDSPPCTGPGSNPKDGTL